MQSGLYKGRKSIGMSKQPQDYGMYLKKGLDFFNFFLCWVISLHRAYRRYFYMNKKTNQTQWDYPEEEEEEESNDAANTDRPHSMSSR